MKSIFHLLHPPVAAFTGHPLIALIACGLIILGGCAQQKKDLYYWGEEEYEQSLSAHFVDAEDEKAYALLSAIVANADSNNHRLAPGIRAEYGYWLYRQGKTSAAIESFEKEAKAFPESALLMNNLIERLKRSDRETSQVETKSAAIHTEAPANAVGGEQ